MSYCSKCLDWLSDMEDAHTEILSLKEDPGTSFFGVFDGHGGEAIYSTLCVQYYA